MSRRPSHILHLPVLLLAAFTLPFFQLAILPVVFFGLAFSGVAFTGRYDGLLPVLLFLTIKEPGLKAPIAWAPLLVLALSNCIFLMINYKSTHFRRCMTTSAAIAALPSIPIICFMPPGGMIVSLAAMIFLMVFLGCFFMSLATMRLRMGQWIARDPCHG